MQLLLLLLLHSLPVERTSLQFMGWSALLGPVLSLLGVPVLLLLPQEMIRHSHHLIVNCML